MQIQYDLALKRVEALRKDIEYVDTKASWLLSAIGVVTTVLVALGATVVTKLAPLDHYADAYALVMFGTGVLGLILAGWSLVSVLEPCEQYDVPMGYTQPEWSRASETKFIQSVLESSAKAQTRNASILRKKGDLLSSALSYLRFAVGCLTLSALITLITLIDLVQVVRH